MSDEKTKKVVKKATKPSKKTAGKKAVSKKTVNKKVVSKKTVNKDRVKNVKKAKKERKVREASPAPEKLPVEINGIANPIVEGGRMKRALAVALSMVEKDEAKLAKLVRLSGIPFKQVNDKGQVKDADLLSKSEWSGQNYARWAVNQGPNYFKSNKEKVEACMPFAKAIAKAQG